MANIVWPSFNTNIEAVGKWTYNPSMALVSQYAPMNKLDFLGQTLSWDVFGPIQGLADSHQLGSRAKKAAAPVLKTLTMGTTYWKTTLDIGEKDILNMRGMGPKERQRKARALYATRMNQLKVMVMGRQEDLTWKAFRNYFKDGVDIDGQSIKVDFGIGAQLTVSIPWTTYASSKPMTDIMNGVMSFRGTGAQWVDVNMNLKTWNDLIQSESIVDAYHGTSLLLDMSNEIKRALQNNSAAGGVKLRNINVYDNSYVDKAGTTTYLLPDNRVQYVAGRNEELPNYDGTGVNASLSVAQFASTPAIQGAATNDSDVADVAAGYFFGVKDESADLAFPYLEITGGIYGFPVVHHPEWLREQATT